MQAWQVISASVTGASHIRDGQQCQDYQDYRCVVANASRGALVAAVADGAGSASLSADGSRIAACAAIRRASNLVQRHVHPLYEAVLQEVLEDAVISAREAIEAEARQRETSIRDFAATLIIAICAPDAIATAQIGDGAVVTSEVLPQSSGEEREYTLFSAPQRGEYANETNFITSDNWRDSLHIRVRRSRVSHLAMFTDGIQSLALDAASHNAPHAPFFTPLFQWAAQQEDACSAKKNLEAFLSSPRVATRADDDLTLLLANPTETASY